MKTTRWYMCKQCGVEWGTDGSKKEWTTCAGCWEEHLAVQRTNIRRAYVERCKVSGTVPTWQFAKSAALLDGKQEPTK